MSGSGMRGIYSYLQSVMPDAPSRTRVLFQRAERELIAKELRTLKDLVASYDNLSHAGRFVANCVFLKARYRPALATLSAALDSRDSLLSGSAHAALSELGGHRVVELMLERYSHGNRRQRAESLSCLACIRNTRLRARDMRLLMDIAMAAHKPHVERAFAVYALAQCCPVKSLRLHERLRAVFQACVVARSAMIQQAAIFGLGALGDSEASVILRRLISSQRGSSPARQAVRAEARRVLRALEGEPSASAR